VLFAVGGACPVHAARYAAQLGIRQVVVPPTSAVQGALGAVTSDVVSELGQSDRMLFPGDLVRINANFDKLVARALAELKAMGFGQDKVVVQRSLDMRYRFQAHELNVALKRGAAPVGQADLSSLDSAFDALYEQSYGRGSGYREAGKEIVTFRVRATAAIGKPEFAKEPGAGGSSNSAVKEKRPVFFEEYSDFTDTPIYDFARLQPGMEIDGPAVIESAVTTIVVNPKDRATMDEYRNLRIFLHAR
jgi:N-methylhydantoinase A